MAGARGSIYGGDGHSRNREDRCIRRVRDHAEGRDGQVQGAHAVPGQRSRWPASWKDYCYDLDDADILKTLTSDSFALKGDDGKVKSVAYVIETYGLIYNKELLSKAGYEQKDITNFASLKAAVEDITSRKDELGFSAFTSCGMDSSSDWRFKTHLANLPIYYEYKADGISTTDAIKGTYLPQYRQISGALHQQLHLRARCYLHQDR